MGIKLNILYIILQPSQFVYNYKQFLFIKFLIFWIKYGEIINFVFVWATQVHAHYHAHFICTGSFCPSQPGQKIILLYFEGSAAILIYELQY